MRTHRAMPESVTLLLIKRCHWLCVNSRISEQNACERKTFSCQKSSGLNKKDLSKQSIPRYLVFEFSVERKLVFWLSCWHLVNTEPLTRRLQCNHHSMFELYIYRYGTQNFLSTLGLTKSTHIEKSGHVRLDIVDV